MGTRTWVNERGTWRVVRRGTMNVLLRWDPELDRWRRVTAFFTVGEAVDYSYGKGVDR